MTRSGSSPTDSPTVRRSSRARRPVTTIYDLAAAKTNTGPDRRKRDVDGSSSSSIDGDEENYGDSGEDHQDSSSENDSDEDASAARTPARKKSRTTGGVATNRRRSSAGASPAAPAKRKNPAAGGRGRARAAGTPGGRRSKAGPKTGPSRPVSTRSAFTKARIAQALGMLSKKALNNHGTDEDDSGNNADVDVDETPENSLLAALLASAKPIPGIPSTERPKTFYCQQQRQQRLQLQLESHGEYGKPPNREKRTAAIMGVCLPQLDGIVRHLIATTDQHGDNGGPHELHVRLLNLLFRSVGGSTRSNIPEHGIPKSHDSDNENENENENYNENSHAYTDLDELEDNDWDDLVSRVVTVMKNESDADQTLLVVADDHDHDDDDDEEIYLDGAPPAPPVLTTRAIGIVVYRTLYKEFWYRLGHVLLAHSRSQPPPMVSDEDEDEDNESDEDTGDSSDSDADSDASPRRKKRKASKPNKKAPSVGTDAATRGFSSDRFQLEKVRDLILRMTELVSVGQPDLRSAATTAVLQLATACVERTVELQQKIAVAARQLRVASRQGSRDKQQTLKHRLDNWKRHKAELEEIVEGPVFQGVFIHRYRDANERIRRDCLRMLSGISLIRPDIFLVDTYLKYFGWMASDKAPSVRIAALEGLSAPLAEARWSAQGVAKPPFSIDIRAMHNVLFKFLDRIVDCTGDADSTRVQEIAIKTMLRMLREELLDEWDDDVAWDKVNLKALDALSSPRVRRDALYFVMDQLDPFDADDDEERKTVGDRKQSDRLVAIARWCANKLCDGFIPIDKLNIQLVDCIVHSILSMPEHRSLVLNWPMILRAIRSENPQQGSETEREDTATQRILLRILATSAELERQTVAEIENRDSTMTGTTKALTSRTRKKSSKHAATEASLDQLSTALLKNLPHLLELFKSDVVSLRDVTKLPPTIGLSALGLPSRKSDLQTLVKTLCQLYLDSTDERVLQNIAQTLSRWVEGDHTRVSEVKINLKRLSRAMQDRLMDLFRESDPQNNEYGEKSRSSRRRSSKTRRRSSSSQTDGASTAGGSTIFSASPQADLEHSISLLMLRWNILLMQCQARYLFETPDEDEDENEVDGLFFTISEAMGKRLSDRMPTLDRDTSDDATAVTTPPIWSEYDPDVHEAVSRTIGRSLKVLLLILSYELHDTLMDRKEFESSESETTDDVEVDEYSLPVLKLRDNLIKLLGLCFDQHLPRIEGVAYSSEQHDFATAVQAGAGEVASDLRTLFPWDWSKAADPVRRSLALTNGEDFTLMLSGFARWFQSREEEISEDTDDASPDSLLREAILPLARVTNMNFEGYFRKEAAMIMQHISGSGSLASQTILALSRSLKKTNPVRMLESQMACLRLAFENWLDNEPDIPEETSPTEEELQAFEEAEKYHFDSFLSMEQVASRLSSTLGVAGRISNAGLRKSIFGFMREGIRYAFDGIEGNQQDDNLMIGSRLAFLSILSKYAIWIKKEKEHLEHVSDYLIEKESELRRHPEFDEVHEEDLNTLADFKKALGIKRVTEISYETDDGASRVDAASYSVATPTTTASGGSSRRRVSSATSRGSVSSRRSGTSVQSELSPLYEEDNTMVGEDDTESSPTQQKRRRSRSQSSRRERSGRSGTKGAHGRETILEENEQESRA